MIPGIVYALCAITSAVCAVLLFRAYLRRRTRLLVWSSLSFVGITLNNVLLFVDLVLTSKAIDLSMPRAVCGFAGAAVLLYGMIWELRD